ncbi:hypothetical protein ABGB18_47720 [Nonomuraea sp. B12E4]|uniref:hypothetical protein n=1 Tax=Nonomuraea sp. B12E4 TaxID=3153564 RepID=UPI00325EA7CA
MLLHLAYLAVTNTFAVLRLLPMACLRAETARAPANRPFHPRPRPAPGPGEPTSERASTTWAGFLRSQADALLACDFIETVTLEGRRQYILAVIEHATRRVRVLGTTDVGIQTVLTGIRMPRMNALMERWVQSCRR